VRVRWSAAVYHSGLVLTDGTVMLRKLALPKWSELFEYGEEFAMKKKLTRRQILDAVRAT